MLDVRDGVLGIMLDDVLQTLMFEYCIVKQHSYGSVKIIHPLITFPKYKELENFLAKKAGKESDNHTVYEIVYGDGASFAISCSDCNMTLGIGIKEVSW